MSHEFLSCMLQALKEGGQIALGLLEDSRPTLKPDHSVLTTADLAVSRLMRERLSPFLSQPGHILIDEEDAQSSRLFDPKILKENPYLWLIDPIDGTRAFANRIPLFGLSMGLVRELKPWIGAVYFPTFKELFYCDGSEAYFVQNAFGPDEKRTPIVPVDQEISRQSIFFGNDGFFREYEWNFSLCPMMMPSSAVIDFCWPTIGRGCGCMFDSYIWDFGGSWPIARAAGLDIRSARTGHKVEQIDLSLFQGQGSLTWRLKENYILSSARNFSVIAQNGLRRRP